jgi:nucleoside-diphosphate-sugar epimerase
MRVLVTGASGFVGGAVVRALLERRHEVRALVRHRARATLLTELGVDLAVGDLDDRPALSAAVSGVQAVLHVAGLMAEPLPGDFTRVNVEGTRNVIEAAEAAGVERLLFVSSVSAVGPSPTGTPLTESQPSSPASAYGRSKADAERLVRAHGERLPYTIVRPPVVYGPGDRKLLPLFKLARFGVLPSAGHGTERVSLVHVRDLAVGMVTALEHPAAARETFFFADPDAPSLHELLRTIGLAAGADVHVVPLPPVAVFGAALLSETLGRLVRRTPMFNSDFIADVIGHSWVCSPDHAREVLGFEAKIGWREGLREAAGWYLAQSLVP